MRKASEKRAEKSCTNAKKLYNIKENCTFCNPKQRLNVMFYTGYVMRFTGHVMFYTGNVIFYTGYVMFYTGGVMFCTGCFLIFTGKIAQNRKNIFHKYPNLKWHRAKFNLEEKYKYIFI